MPQRIRHGSHRVHRGHRTIASWIALVAILMVTFAPSVSRVVDASRGLAWGPVCSADTALSAGVQGPSSGDVPGDGHALSHCPYCALHADLVVLPDPRHAEAVARLLLREPPAAFLDGPRASWIWARSQARAPPSRA